MAIHINRSGTAMAQAKRDWVRTFEELNLLLKGEKFPDLIKMCDGRKSLPSLLAVLAEEQGNEVLMQVRWAALIHTDQYKTAMESMMVQLDSMVRREE